MKKLYEVNLSEQDRESLKKKLSSGQSSARILKRAAILLKADAGMKDKDIAKEVMVGHRTVERVRKRFCEAGLARVLSNPTPERVYKRKFDGEQEAHVIALACSPAPEGRSQWSLRLLADKIVELEIVDELAPETLRQLLKKTNLNLSTISTGA